MTGNGKLIIFSAPSGSGKTTIVRYLLEQIPELAFSISATSREPRGKEVHRKDYYFLSDDEFKARAQNNEFLEWEEVYNGTKYGTLKAEVERLWEAGKHVVFDIDVVGGLNLKKQFSDRALAIYVQAPNIAELERRLRKRGTETDEKIDMRLRKAGEEAKRAPEFDLVIVNDDLERAKQEALKAISEFIDKRISE
jgi:guanylate kinase